MVGFTHTLFISNNDYDYLKLTPKKTPPNTTVCSSPQSNFFTGNFLFFSFFFWFSSLRSGGNFSVKLAALGMNFARWFILPGNDLNCFSDFGGFGFCIASVLVNFGLTPERCCPHQFTWFLKNSHFEIFNARFLSSSFSVPFLLIFHVRFHCLSTQCNVVQKKQKAFFAWLKIRSIAFWNSAAGMSANP